MKKLFHWATAFAVSATLAAAAPAFAQSAADLDAWAKANGFGKYAMASEDWNDIIAKAKTEGEVVVYSSSSRIAKVAKTFMDIYPEIKVTGHDLGSVQTVEKTVREQDAGLFNADIVTTGGSGQVFYEMLKKDRIFNYVPAAYKDRIPVANRDPLLIRVNEAMVFMYNTEVYPDGQPVTNIWQLTEPKWKGKVGIKNPPASLSTFMGVATLVQHADEMAAAYKRHTGQDIKLSPDAPDAGYEFIYRLLHNDAVIFKSGSKLGAATGKPGQKNPLIGFNNMTRIADNEKKKFVSRFLVDLDPVAKVIYPTELVPENRTGC